MDMDFGEVFQKLSSLIAGISFVGNWPEKHSPPWKGQVLKNDFFYKSEAGFKFLSKSMCTNCFPFLKIQTRSWSNLQKNLKYEGEFNLTLHSSFFFLHILLTSCKPLKKIKAVCVDSFLRGTRIWSQICKKNHFEKLTFP